MKLEDMKILNVTPISLDLPEVINVTKDDIRISHLDDKSYMILKKEMYEGYSINDYYDSDWNVNIISKPKNENNNNNNFIVDMNGIDNFITAKSLVFKDSDVRKIVASNVDNVCKSKYLRFGVSGARPSDLHPGGEVVEIQTLDFKKNIGTSISVSGCLKDDETEYSEAKMLSEDGVTIRDERTVYSHSAWINEEENTPIVIKATAKNDGASVLDLIYDYCRVAKIYGVAIKLELDGDNSTKVKGRVLKHLPKRPFKEVQEATDIAIEQGFRLPEMSKMKMYGTLYKRFEPEWEQFTSGRQYERRGHYHAVVLENETDRLHEVFHVREILMQKGGGLIMEIYPVGKIYRIYPVESVEGNYKIISSQKDIEEHIRSFDSQAIEI